MPYSKKGWTDQWDFTVEEDDADIYELRLEVLPATLETGPEHSFISTVTIARYEQVREPNIHENWAPQKPTLIHRSEHGSIADGVRAAREAAKRAELLRVGPEDE